MFDNARSVWQPARMKATRCTDKPAASRFPIDMDAARAFLAAKQARRKALLDERFQRATDDCARIVESIVRLYHPLRIWQWGSLLDRTRFSEISDIDLALEGVNGPEAFFAILGLASSMTNFPVDIVELERVGKANADYIRTKGKLIHERSESF